VVVRAKMILYAADGQSNAEIARRLETAADVVRPLAETLLRRAAARS
jgi:DNA-binding CsgD family transcriptional regulator